MESVWVFNGNQRSGFPAGIFQNKESAEIAINRHLLSGVLTEYPLDCLVYEWAIEHGYFRSTNPDKSTAQYIGAFQSASQRHFHYENGYLIG